VDALNLVAAEQVERASELRILTAMNSNAWKVLEARGGIEPPIWVLQTHALPLGDRAPVGATATDKLRGLIWLTTNSGRPEARPLQVAGALTGPCHSARNENLKMPA
jgi:hypothetical protein